jgi:hypothetical protein
LASLKAARGSQRSIALQPDGQKTLTTTISPNAAKAAILAFSRLSFRQDGDGENRKRDHQKPDRGSGEGGV